MNMGFSFEMEINSRYTEILELAERMRKLKIPYELRPCYDGWEILYPNAANVIMDAVSHILVNDSKNLVEVMGPDRFIDERCTGAVYESLTAAQAIEYFYIHYRMNRRSVNRLLPPRSIRIADDSKPEFYDIESREYVSRTQLRREFEIAKINDPMDEHGHKNLTFAQYINNCMTRNNGTLIEVKA